MHYSVSSYVLKGPFLPFKKMPFKSHSDVAFWRGFWIMKGLGGRNVLLGFILWRKGPFSEQKKL